MVILCENIGKNWFVLKTIVRNMQISRDVFINVLENDDSILQAKFGVHSYHFKYSQNNPLLKSRDHTNPPPHTSQLWKLTLPPGKVVGSCFFFFFLTEMRGKDEIKGVRNDSITLLCVLEHRGEICLGVVAIPLRRTRVKLDTTTMRITP